MTSVSESFYQQIESSYRASAHCRGPWHPDFQHGGPPSALIARAIERQADGMHVARINLDLLKPVPLADFDIQLSEITGGKRRRVLQAELIDRDSKQCVVRANALLLRPGAVDPGPLPDNTPAAPLPPAQCEAFAFGFFGHDQSYDTAMQLKRDKRTPGPGQGRVWMAARIPLLDQETISPLQRILLAVDSGSGISMAVDPLQFSFINADLNVSLLRYARSRWVGLDSRSHFNADGTGLCDTRIWDEAGLIGHATQNLILQQVS